MSGKTVLILGGGWGGLTIAHHLRSLLPPEHRVVIVERNSHFSLHVSNLWLMTGERSHRGHVERPMKALKRDGIEWIHAEARGLDPVRRTVTIETGELSADYLVIALGAELAPQVIPGFEEAAFNLYEVEGAIQLHQALEAFGGGKIVVLVAGVPFRCPAAPYEAAMLMASALRERSIGDRSEVALYTPEAHPMAVTGPAVGEALESMLEEKTVSYHPQHQVTEIDPVSRTVYFGEVTTTFDLLVGIPAHKAPPVVRDAGLIDDSGYIPVHPQTLEVLGDVDTLETRFENVFAIGDVTSVRLLNQMLLPKAGVFAEGEAAVVAAAIAADVAGEPKPRGFDGAGFCYVEVGEAMAAHGSGDFYAYPAPRVTLEMPTKEARNAKEEYERVLETWFES